MGQEPPSNPANAGNRAPLILASSSPYRRELLRRLPLPFRWKSPAIDESPRPGERAGALVRRLSISKARALAPDFERHLIIAGDQVAVLDGLIIGKPGHRAGAIEQLVTASGRALRFLTGLCVLDTVTGNYEVEVVPTDVHFRALSRARIEAYVDADEPYDCAGSFKAEGLGIILFERIVSTDPSALMGLPLITLVSMLARAGVDSLHELPGHRATGDEIGQ